MAVKGVLIQRVGVVLGVEAVLFGVTVTVTVNGVPVQVPLRGVIV
jgi:hypothetical protein